MSKEFIECSNNKWKKSNSCHSSDSKKKDVTTGGCSNAASPVNTQNPNGGDATVVSVGLVNILNIAIGGAAVSLGGVLNVPLQANVCDNEVDVEVDV
ncbi:hypothetical protein [Heyndrickxia ginsengihumi]|uniref:Uncharacterized protein n=1 Tax=Heyndrickxia ginsengihumi TaxID=363870 RepID=A0A0A6VCF4_9BACI|nr:hypothetical protein [Heyndrickxia ginsengihumi]KHD85173.1 hypothetical protein NG54_10920 [Heyndrickxia ginsengihumi]MBE6185291.1 hypothetical protein [Bacillus sp. (in: firmicutes)]MCM3025008.1 hypothetical protein [Heyndrickxia ginsengihumi]NEY18804.1 hypothetical protein [Heyndrickxia ginsengihumi]